MSITKKPWFISKEKSSSSNFWKSRQSGYTASNYWLKDSLFDRRQSMFTADQAMDDDASKKYDYYQLAQYQRAISNFVRIMTGRSDISVQYATNGGNQNYTDGKTVTLSPNIKEKEFDVAVGLALHESSHIVYTDFVKWNEYISHARRMMADLSEAETKKLLLNLVEDLYIDAMTYKAAPGYRGYYAALYQKFFGDAKIVEGLWSQDYAQPTWDNYLFHLINIRNPKRNLDALPGLKTMFSMLNLQQITRLNEMQDRIDLANALYAEISKWVDASDKMQQYLKQNSGGGDMSDEEMLQKLNEALEAMSPDEDGEGEGDNEEAGGGNSPLSGFQFPDGISPQDMKTNALDLDKLSEKAKQNLQRMLAKQKDLVNGKTSKGKVSKETQAKITAMATADVDRVVVGKSYAEDIGYSAPKGITLNIIRRLTESFIQKLGSDYGVSSSDLYHNYGAHGYSSRPMWIENRVKNVEEGIMRGKLLAKKMQIRNEERVLKSSRLNAGKIDKRLLHEIGLDNFDIFEKINITTYKPSYIHLSIDASSSMNGPLFESAIQLAAMFATASKYIQNIHLQISTRSTIDADKPYLMYIFDSKKDSIQTIRSLFPRLSVRATTPEGLAFEGIVNEISKQARNTDAYFINICDGEPYMRFGDVGYSGPEAQKHSKLQMQKMEKAGIKFITYFIGGEHDFKAVQKCYGNNAHRLSSAKEIGGITKAMRTKLMDA